MLPVHPYVECVVHEQVGEHRTNDPSLGVPRVLAWILRAVPHLYFALVLSSLWIQPLELLLRYFIGGSFSVVSVEHTCRGLRPDFSLNVHHRSFCPPQLKVVWSLHLHGGSEGATLISCVARLHDCISRRNHLPSWRNVPTACPLLNGTFYARPAARATYHSIVASSPCAKSNSGVYPNRVRALDISAREWGISPARIGP